MNFETEIVKISELKFPDYNPRKLSADQEKHLRESLDRFGFVDPVIVNRATGRENVIVGGNQRVKVWQKMGNKAVPVHYVSLTLEQERELNIRLNKNSGEWDFELLVENFSLPDLTEWGFDANEFSSEYEESKESLYSKNIEAPIYSPNNEKPQLNQLCDDQKVIELTARINLSESLSEQEKEFLIKAAERHRVFYYDKIADLYCNADCELQKLMEESALVIIDFNKAIEYGYVELSEKMIGQYTDGE